MATDLKPGIIRDANYGDELLLLDEIHKMNVDLEDYFSRLEEQDLKRQTTIDDVNSLNLALSSDNTISNSQKVYHTNLLTTNIDDRWRRYAKSHLSYSLKLLISTITKERLF